MMKAWMRQLVVEVSRSSDGKTIKYGDNEVDNLAISISGTKYLSTMKDNCSITIANLTYAQIVELIDRGYDVIKIKAGYRHSNFMTIFDGSILYISNKMVDKANNDVIIVCTSKLLGLYNGRLLNLTLTSGINMYSALSYVCKVAGIKNFSISESLKARLITNAISSTGTAASVIETLCSSVSTLCINSDSSSTSVVSIWDAYREDKRVIALTEDNILLTQGYPTLDTNGLTINVLPTFNFVPGDVIQIDNSMIDISLSSKDEVLSTPNIGVYLDSHGQYMVYEVSYNLQNRGSNFYLRLLCKKRDLLKGVTS